MKLGEMAYRQAQEAQAGQPDSAAEPAKANGKAPDDVVDADFTDVSDDNNKKSA